MCLRDRSLHPTFFLRYSGGTSANGVVIVFPAAESSVLSQRRKKLPQANCLCCHHQPMAIDAALDASQLVRVTVPAIDAADSCYRPIIASLSYSPWSLHSNMLSSADRVGKYTYRVAQLPLHHATTLAYLAL